MAHVRRTLTDDARHASKMDHSNGKASNAGVKLKGRPSLNAAFWWSLFENHIELRPTFLQGSHTKTVVGGIL